MTRGRPSSGERRHPQYELLAGDAVNPNRRTLAEPSTTHWILILCVVLFAGILRIPSLTQPLGPDQGIMSVIGEGILQGRLPYRDFWEMGSPAIFFTYALMFKLFGTRMAAVPITDMLVSMLTTFLVFLVASRVWSRNVGCASAVLFAFFSNGVRIGMHAGGSTAFGTFWYIAQRETFMLPLIAGSFWLLLGPERNVPRLRGLAMAGFLSGLAFVFKFPSLVIFLCLLFYLNLRLATTETGTTAKRVVTANLALLLGFAVPLLLFVLLFWTKGATHEMIDIVFRYVCSVYGQMDRDLLASVKLGLTHTLFLAEENFVLWIFFVTSSIDILVNERNKEKALMVLWALASVLFVVSHREFFGYHYLILLPPFSILAGYGLVKALGPTFRLRNAVTGEFGKVFVLLALSANLVFFTTLNYMHYTKFYYYVTGRISQEDYYTFFNAYPEHDYSFAADYEVARYILDNTDEQDTIFTLGGIESVIHFMTKRQSPSRFIFSWIIFSGKHGEVEQAERYRNEVLEDLKAAPPKYILAVRSLDEFSKFTDIHGFIERNYILEKTFADDRYLYVHRGAESKDA
jgi:hypothetical protein